MNRRLVTSRLCAGIISAIALLTTHAWTEHGALDDVLGATGLLLLLVACIGRIWCASYVAGRKDRELVDKGPFSVTRNPLYFFSFFGFIGAGLSFENFTMALIFGGLFLATHWPTILYEEGKLREIFGAPYDAYCARVPRFIPRLSLFEASEVTTLRTKAFTRTLVEGGCIPLVYLGAQIVEQAHTEKWLPVLFTLP